eukprot:TRINITY_DN2426_c0_g1_i1.p1 TRINITY_DN2426_c0_g1~~TRINITY_DN2426_c0_g1_i1.p1  ORF type:complete len:194 (-),score=32.30 TRINITY_DN2426_c0_g1_i1:278-859(-)
MPPTEAKRMQLGTVAPAFQLREPLTGKVWKSPEDFQQSPALLVMFICNHCPFVIHLKQAIVDLANEYIPKGVAIVAISSNSVATHPEDGPDFMAEEARKLKYPFPYLYDEAQSVAKSFGAVCTPEFYVFKNENQTFQLAYHGQFDDSRPNGRTPITGSDLRQALDCVLSGQPLNFIQKPSIGCGIKWHPSNDM